MAPTKSPSTTCGSGSRLARMVHGSPLTSSPFTLSCEGHAMHACTHTSIVDNCQLQPCGRTFGALGAQAGAYRLEVWLHPRADHVLRLRSPLPHLHRDCALRCHICAGTGCLSVSRVAADPTPMSLRGCWIFCARRNRARCYGIVTPASRRTAGAVGPSVLQPFMQDASHARCYSAFSRQPSLTASGPQLAAPWAI